MTYLYFFFKYAKFIFVFVFAYCKSDIFVFASFIVFDVFYSNTGQIHHFYLKSEIKIQHTDLQSQASQHY